MLSSSMTFLLGGIFLALGVWFYAIANRLRARSGLPAGRIIYEDSSGRRECSQPLFSYRLGLVGKPDYLLELADGTLVPVEVKSGSAPAAPYDGHVMQLIAYCALVEETTGRRPPAGLLRYADQTFEISYAAELEEDLLDLLAEMRRDQAEPAIRRSHGDAGRCRACGVRQACDERLK